MKYQTKKNIFFQEAFILSLVAHIGAIYFLVHWSTNNINYTQKIKPIQIKTIIYKPPVKPKPKKADPIQPVVKTVSAVSKRSVSLPVNKAKPVTPIFAKPIQPVIPQRSMDTNKFLHPPKPIQSVRVAKLDFRQILPSPSFIQIRQLKNIVRPHSAQPVIVRETIVSLEESSQEAILAKEPERFSTVPTSYSKIGARKVSESMDLSITSMEPTQEISSKIITAPSNRIQPVQVASISGDFIDMSQDKELDTSGNSQGAVDSSGKDLEAVRRAFSSGIRGRIAKTKYYPQFARRQGWEGKPVIEFQIGSDGSLLGYSIVVASPYKILDQAALDAVKDAGPFPQIPKSLKANFIKFILPISFKLD